MSETVMQALEMLVQGMSGIFVVLGLIALMGVLLRKGGGKR